MRVKKVKKTHLNREEPARYVARAKELQAAQVHCPQSVLRMQSEGVRVPSLNGNDRITIDGSVPSVPAD